MDISTQYRNYKGFNYAIWDLIKNSEDLEIEEVNPNLISFAVDLKAPESLFDFAMSFKRVNNSSLEYPILLAPCGFILDGRHRLIKSIALGLDKIKYRQFSVMPPCGFNE